MAKSNYVELSKSEKKYIFIPIILILAIWILGIIFICKVVPCHSMGKLYKVDSKYSIMQGCMLNPTGKQWLPIL